MTNQSITDEQAVASGDAGARAGKQLATNDHWWRDAVIYQIYPKSFNDTNGDGIGDLQGVIEKLDYLAELGIDAIWFSPMFKSPNVDNGYDISDYRAIGEEYGTMEEFDELLEQAKARGIRIVLDLVVNHSSSEHKWFKEALKSKDNPYRDYYIWRDPNSETGGEPYEIGAVFGGSAWKLDPASGQYYFHLFAEEQPDLNWQNPKMRHEIYDMMNFWFDKGISGFRMDVIDCIGKDIDKKIIGDGPYLHQFMHEMNRESLSHYDSMSVSESGSVTPETALLWTDPAREEISMVFQFQHVNVDGMNGKSKWESKPFSISHLKRVFNNWETKIDERMWLGLFWSNHDQPRVVNRWGAGRNADRALQERSAKALAYILHFMKGTPYIYQGEEFGMTSGQFTELSELDDLEEINAYNELVPNKLSHDEMFQGINISGRDTGRTPLCWDTSENAGFTTGKPWLKINDDFKECNAQNALTNLDSVFYHYKQLIAFRKNNPLVIWGDYELLETKDDVWAYVRSYEGRHLLVVANLSDQPNTFSCAAQPQPQLSTADQGALSAVAQPQPQLSATDQGALSAVAQPQPARVAQVKEVVIQNTERDWITLGELSNVTLEPFEAFAAFI